MLVEGDLSRRLLEAFLTSAWYQGRLIAVMLRYLYFDLRCL